MSNKLKFTFMALLLGMISLNGYIFTLKNANHSTDVVDEHLNKARLNVAKIKNETLAILFLNKEDYLSLSKMQLELRENNKVILEIVNSENTNPALHQLVVGMQNEWKEFNTNLDIIKTNLLDQRVSEAYIKEVVLKSEQLPEVLRVEVIQLVNSIVSQDIDDIKNIEKRSSRLLVIAESINFNEFKSIELLIKHSQIILNKRRAVLSLVNTLLSGPIEEIYTRFSVQYHQIEDKIIEGYTTLLKMGILLNTIAFGLFIALVVGSKRHTDETGDSTFDVTDMKTATSIFTSFSHRVKNPMNGILGMMSLLKATKFDEEQGQYIQGIEQSATYLSTLLHDLVEYSKLKSGEARVNYKTVDFNRILKEHMKKYRQKALEKGLNFSLKFSEEFPEHVTLDIDKLLIIVENMVDNSIKYTDTGFVNMRALYTKLGEGHGKLLLEFHDSGKGIKEESIEDLLLVLEDTEDEYGRDECGIGVSICNEMIKLMGGDFSLDKSVKVGSRFIVELQVQVDTNDELIEQVNEDLSELEHYRVLVAEDEKINQKVITGMLKKLNQSVKIVNNGKELVDHFYPGDYDLILVDMVMPEMDGLEATKELNLKYSDNLPPIIALSGNEKDKYLDKCLKVGMVDFLSKPVKKSELKNILVKYCSSDQKVNVA